MGNSQTKESRAPTPSQGRNGEGASQSGGGAPVYSSRAGRGSRPDLSFLGLGSSSNNAEREVPEVRRETKQEREARKLEKERVAREKERERSMKEEHVDGGYLVTQGVYTGTEDFSKTIVRQLMIERRIAPFWRGLNDFKEDWTEHQLVAAAKGLPIPAADEIPPEDPDRPSAESRQSSTPNLQNLTVPMAGRSASYGSDASATLSPSHPAFSLPAPSSPLASQSSSQPGSSSLFRPRSKTLASLTTSLKTPPQEQIVPQEVQLPKDPYVNGQKMEAFLYKDAEECPICFIYYPPYLNKTRCCDQPICSECFVQIKRPDPHPPEHHDPSQPAPAIPPPEEAESLVSEPSTCPYCQQEEFGVTYEPPPLRRGLSYANNGAANLLGSAASAMSSSTSLNSMGSPTLQPSAARRRTTSISANASTVITTDRIRPDWATKLANARNHAARRSAAATALHTAAYLMGNNSGSDSRGFGFGSSRRFGRSRDSPSDSGAATPSTADRDARISQLQSALAEARSREPASSRPGATRRSRMDDLEDMMMMEAIRLSLAAEEERKKKEEKAAAKEAKKKEKADKKAEKKAQKGMYSAGGSSASGSALSLSLPGVGRRRGNSGSSAFLREATLNQTATNNSTGSVLSNDKGKTVDRGVTSSPSAPIPIGGSSMGSAMQSSSARHNVDSGLAAIPQNDTLALTQSPTNATQPEKPSHLRQMSNVSSAASSFVESVPGSLRNGNTFRNGSTSSIDSPNASGTHLAGTQGNEDGGSGSGTPGTEPMFNFRSLAAMIDREDEKDKDSQSEHVEDSSRRRGHQRGESSASAFDTSDEPLEQRRPTLKPDIDLNGHDDEDIYGNDDNDKVPRHAQFQGLGHMEMPELTVTPVTPAPGDHTSKQLGEGMNFEVRNVTQ